MAIPAGLSVRSRTTCARSWHADSTSPGRPRNASSWYRESADELAATYFLPFGFTPERADSSGPAQRFVPLGPIGYALIRDDMETTDPDAVEGRYFEIDDSARETLGDADLAKEWRELDEALSDVRAAVVVSVSVGRPYPSPDPGLTPV